MADPCLSCELPDCDDTSPDCLLKRLRRRYFSKLKRRENHLVTEEERIANNLVHEAWRIDRIAEASEGGRSLRRGATVYGARAHG